MKLKFLISILMLIASVVHGAVPSYQSFIGTNGIIIRSNPPTGAIIIDGALISGPTNGTTATTVTSIVYSIAGNATNAALSNVVSNPFNNYTNGPGWTTNLLFAVQGDSLSTTNPFSDVGTDWTKTWQGSLYTFYPRWQLLPNTNWALSGKSAFTMSGEYASTFNAARPNVTNELHGGIAFVWGGFNDMRGGSNAAATFSYLSNIWFRARLDNYLVVAFTVHQSTGISFQAAQEVQRKALNNLIRTPANRYMFDYLADVETWTTNTAAQAMLSVFDGDGIHFNTAGNRFLAANINSNFVGQSVAPIGMRGGTIDGRLQIVGADNSAANPGLEVFAANKTVSTRIGYEGININGGDLYLQGNSGAGKVGINFDPLVAPPKTTLDVHGATATAYRLATLTSGNYTTDSAGGGLAQDSIIGIPNGSLRTNTLFDATAFAGREITILDAGGTAAGVGSNVYILPVLGQTINGAGSTNIAVDLGSITLVSDGSNFKVKVPTTSASGGGGGGGGASTNANQFGAAGAVITIKDGAKLTNLVVYTGSPGLTVVPSAGVATNWLQVLQTSGDLNTLVDSNGLFWTTNGADIFKHVRVLSSSGVAGTNLDINGTTTLLYPNTANTGTFSIGDPSQAAGRWLTFSKSGASLRMGSGGITAFSMNTAGNGTVAGTMVITGAVSLLNTLTVSGQQTNQSDVHVATEVFARGYFDNDFFGDLVLQSDPTGEIVESSVTSGELFYLVGLTSSVQGQLNAKVEELNGVATNLTGRGVTLPTLTASRALVLNASGNVTNALGTPTGSKFLRDDNTYAVPPGSVTSLNDLTDVETLATPQLHDVLTWDGTVWTNRGAFFQFFIFETTTNIFVGSNMEQQVTIKTNISFQLVFTGTPQPGEMVNLSVSNYGASTIYMTNSAYDPTVASNVTLFAIPGNSIRDFKFLNNTNFNLGTPRWELIRSLQKESELAVGTNLTLTTNGDASVITVDTVQGITTASAPRFRGIQIGSAGNAVMTNLWVTNVTLDFPSTTLNSADLPVTYSLAAAGDIVEVGPPTASMTAINGTYTGFASNGVIYVRFQSGGTAQDPASGTYKVVLKKFL